MVDGAGVGVVGAGVVGAGVVGAGVVGAGVVGAGVVVAGAEVVVVAASILDWINLQINRMRKFGGLSQIAGRVNSCPWIWTARPTRSSIARYIFMTKAISVSWLIREECQRVSWVEDVDLDELLVWGISRSVEAFIHFSDVKTCTPISALCLNERTFKWTKTE